MQSVVLNYKKKWYNKKMLLKTNILVTRDTQKFELLEVKGLITIIAKLPSWGPAVFKYADLYTRQISNLK